MSWPGLLRTWFTFSDWFLHVSFSRFQHSNLHFGSLLHCFIKLSSAIGYSFAKDCCPCLLLFICKGPLSILILSYSFGFCYMFTKDRGPCLPVYLQRTLSLFLVLFTKDRSLCLLLFICKRPRPLCCDIHLQRTAALVVAIHLQRTLSLSGAIYLQRTAVLVLGYSFAKDRGPCLISLQRTAVLVLCNYFVEKTALPNIRLLSWQDKMDRRPSKAWGNCLPVRACENGCFTD